MPNRIFSDVFDAQKILEEYTKISSGSYDHPGVERAQNFLATLLESLGFEIRWHTNPLGAAASARFLEALSPGSKPGWITLVGHADTLDHGLQEAGQIPFDRTEDRLIAPGVLDDKASQILALWGLEKFLRDRPAPSYGLRFLSSPNEELGSRGFHDLYREFAKDSIAALGLEPAYRGLHIVQERRGNRWYDVEIEGIEAHSGRDPEKGLSALHDLSIKVSKMIRLNNLKKGISLNIGEITSENPTYNLISGKARAKIDLRFLDLKSRNRCHKKIHRLLSKSQLKKLPDGRSTQTRYEIVDDCPPLKASRDSKKLALAYLQILHRLEKTTDIEAVRSGGAADVCYMARPGLPILDGLGACGGNMHRKDEFVMISSLQNRSNGLVELLQHLNR